MLKVHYVLFKQLFSPCTTNNIFLVLNLISLTVVSLYYLVNDAFSFYFVNFTLHHEWILSLHMEKILFSEFPDLVTVHLF